MLPQISLAVVGIDFPNKRGPSRRFAAELCRPGDPIELRPEPANKHDPRAIAAYAHGIQLGYLTAERCGRIGQIMGAGTEVEAIFQRLDKTAAIIRVAFDGEFPELPPVPCHEDEEVWMETA